MADILTLGTTAPAIAIGEHTIHALDGLYSLNDLHAASGSEERHTPNRFMRLDQTLALIDEISKTPEMAFKVLRGRNGGTYACRELVIAYAAWISAAFHLKVIQSFLAASTAAAQPAPAVDPDRIKRAQSLAATAVTQVYHTVFEAVLAGRDNWWTQRWLLSFNPDCGVGDRPTLPMVKTVPADAMVFPLSKVHELVDDPGLLTTDQIVRISTVCINRLEHMFSEARRDLAWTTQVLNRRKQAASQQAAKAVTA